MPRHGLTARLTGGEWQRLRADIALQASVRGCPDGQVDFVVSTALFAAWVAEALDRCSTEDPGRSVAGWASRAVRALIWSVRREEAGGMVHGSYEDTEAWDLLLTVQDSIPVFLEVSKRDAERIQELCAGKGRVSEGDMKQARQAFLRQVVPALNAIYGSEN
jgi:hypothetical protein